MYSVSVMVLLTIFLMCMFLTLAVGVMAGVSDFRSLKIPNVYSVYVILAFLVSYTALAIGGQDLVFSGVLSHVMSVGITFVVTLILFALKVLGAGDSKFASACACWISVKYLPVFLFFMTLCGGVLGVAALVIKRKKPFKEPRAGGWIDQIQNGADKVPYGIAISFGMLIAFVYSGYFSPNVLASFLPARSL